MGLGAYPATDRQFIGMLGMHGTYEANMAMHECDVLFAIGARFDDRVTGKIAEFCPTAKIIHIDVDPASISKTVRVDIPIVGEVASVLEDMLEMLKSGDRRPDAQALAQWWDQIARWQGINCLAYDRSDKVIKPQYVIEQLWEVTRGRCLRYLRRGPASDVGGAVLPVRQAQALDQFRRARHHGLRHAGGDRRQAGISRRPMWLA